AVGAREQARWNPGRTGVVSVDFLHWELSVANKYMEQLIKRIHARYEAGEQRFRWVGKPVIRCCLEFFSSQPDDEVIPEAKRRCRHKLCGAGANLPRPTAEEFRRHFRANRPKIPKQVLEERAYFRHKETGEHDRETNWKEAERGLLELYESGFTEHAEPV